MKAKKINHKSKIKALLLIVLGFLTTIPLKANAGLEDIFLKPLENIGMNIVLVLNEAILYLLNWLAKTAAGFFDAMLRIGFIQPAKAVEIAWGVTRDIANMFFILFLVVVAFGTILKSEQYGWRKLLPKIILIALLINFSFLLCSVIIDLSNITANFFIKDIQKQLTDSRGLFGKTFLEGLGTSGTYVTFTDCDHYKTTAIASCDEIFKTGIFYPSGSVSKQACYEKAEELYQQCVEQGSIRVVGEKTGDFLNVFLSMTVGSIVLLIASFTLFAGGIILLIRIISLWFLIILVPLVFVCYILPGLQSNWRKWWQNFLKWCFFAPAYAFCIWVAIQISTSNAHKQIASSVGNITAGDFGPLSNQFVVNPAEQLVSYFIVGGLLIGSLIVAKSFGVYGANTAINIGQKMRKGATKWIGARTRERTARPMSAIAQGTGKLYGATLGKIPLIKELGIGKIAQLPAQVMRNQQKDIANEKTKLSSYSPDALKSLFSTFTRTQQIAAAQILAEKGKLSARGAFKEKDIRRVTQVAKRYGAEGPLIESRVDLAESVDKTIEEALTKVISKNKLKEMQPISFKAPQGVKVAKTLMKLCATPAIFRTRFMSMPLNTQEELMKTTRQMISNKEDSQRDEYRPFYAAATGDVDVAFATEAELKIYEEKRADKKPYQIKNVENEPLKKFVGGINAIHFKEISPNSIQFVAKHVKASEAKEFGKTISEDLKEEFVRQWEKQELSTNEEEQKLGTEIIEELKNHPAWKSYIKRPTSSTPPKAEDIKVKKARENLENM